MKRILSVVLVIAIIMTCMALTVSADAASPVETIPAVRTSDDLKGMIGNLAFGPSYTISEVEKGIKVDGAVTRGVYERIEVNGLWTLDGLRIEMADVSTKSSLMVCLVDSIGGFPTGGAGKAIGLDPTSNKLWITGEGANNLVAETDMAIEPGWSNGTDPAIDGNYTIQFNKMVRGCWIVTVNDCAAYEVPAETLDALLDSDGKTMISFVSNAAADVEDKAVTFTVTKYVENAAFAYLPNVRTSFVPKAIQAEGEGAAFNDPKLNTSVDNAYIFNNVFGGSYELANVDDNGGVSVYAYDDRGEYERLNIGGLWNMDGLRIEFKDVESVSPIMLGLINNYGSFVTPSEKLSAFAIGYEGGALRITDGAENVYTENTAQELKDKELIKPAHKSADAGAYWEKKCDYTIQFNKLENGKWLVTVDDCIQYEFDESVLNENVNMASTALAITVNPKNNEAKFTIAAIRTGVQAPEIKDTPVDDKDDNKGDDNKGDNNKDDNKDDNERNPQTGDFFPALAVAAVLTCGAAVVLTKKKYVR